LVRINRDVRGPVTLEGVTPRSIRIVIPVSVTLRGVIKRDTFTLCTIVSGMGFADWQQETNKSGSKRRKAFCVLRSL